MGVILASVSMLRPDRGRAASPQPLRAIFEPRAPLELLPDPRDTATAFIERRIRAVEDDEEVGSIVLFELDHLDQLIVELGARLADSVLTRFEAMVEGSFRSSDPVTRLSDARLMVVVEGAPIGEAARRAERVRNELQTSRFDGPRGEPLWVTASAGCAVIGRDEEAIGAAVEAAETALETARRAGRNRVIAAR